MKRKLTAVGKATQERAGQYIRVSLDRSAHGMQDEILSPETQEDRGRQYCAAQGWTVVAVERDIDESGYRQHYSQREGLMRLLAAVERGELTKIVVWKFSRLSRRLKEFIEICDRVEQAGAGVVAVTEQIDTSTPAGRLIRNILASFAQFQSEEISEQIFEAWMTKAKRGERPGGLAPFGTINNKGILEPHPELHRHLVAMFETFRDTGSVKAVWDYLAGAGVPAPVAAEWSLNTIRGILTNATYIGRLEWAGETFQARWEPLVPLALWEEVQGLLRSRRTLPTKRRDARLLTGLIRCAVCGRPMWTRYTKRSVNGGSRMERFYWCCLPHNQRRGCDVPTVCAEEVEGAVWRAALDLIQSPGFANQVERYAALRNRSAGDEAGAQRQRLLAEKEKVEHNVGMLFDLLGAGDITREEFRAQRARYQERLHEIQQQLRELEALPVGPTPHEFRQAAATAISAATDEDRRQVLAKLGVQVVVSAARVELHVLGLRMNLRARQIGNTFYLGPDYQRLDHQGPLFTDKQLEFVRRTYAWADKHEIARRIGRSYASVVFAAQRLRKQRKMDSAGP